MIHNTSPRGIRLTPSKERQAASFLRSIAVGRIEWDAGSARVTTVHLKTLSDGAAGGDYYFFNGRLRVEDGEPYADSKRWPLRCARWKAADAAALLARLEADPHVILCGRDAEGCVFAVARVANGTEDQQREASGRWAEAYGREFPRGGGNASLVAGSMSPESPVSPEGAVFANWRAKALETAPFERYSTPGDYAKPARIAGNRPGRLASASERAAAYVDALPESFDSEGSRNAQLSTAMLRMRELFGVEALAEVMPRLLARTSLDARETGKMAKRILKGKERA